MIDDVGAGGEGLEDCERVERSNRFVASAEAWLKRRRRAREEAEGPELCEARSDV